MSPSWSSWLPGSGRAAGLMLGRERAAFALAAAGGRIIRVDERSLEMPLFTGEPTEATAAALAKTLGKLAPEAAREYLPLHVSLPGAAVQVGVFALDALPAKRTLQLELARWHLVQAGAPAQALVCDCEPLGTDGNKHLLFGCAMDRAWHDCVVDALDRAGMRASSLNADACRQFNHFHDRLCADTQGGALFVPTPDAWSLLLWDAAGRVRHCSSRWRRDEPDEAARLAVEVERRILACVQSLPGLGVGRFYAVVPPADAELVAAIDARLRAPCVRLQPAAGGEPEHAESTRCRLGAVTAALQP